MTNSEELRNLIKKNGLKLKFVAESIGLSSYGFQLKIDNKKEFKTSEIVAICELLNIKSLEEKERIFFAKKDDLKSISNAAV